MEVPSSRTSRSLLPLTGHVAAIGRVVIELWRGAALDDIGVPRVLAPFQAHRPALHGDWLALGALLLSCCVESLLS